MIVISEAKIREGLGSIAVTHPYWKALDTMLYKAAAIEAEDVAKSATGEEALRAAGRLSMILDFATVLRSEMSLLAGEQKP